MRAQEYVQPQDRQHALQARKAGSISRAVEVVDHLPYLQVQWQCQALSEHLLVEKCRVMATCRADN